MRAQVDASSEELRQGQFNALCGLLDSIEEFGDRDFQDRAWLTAIGPEVSSYSEAMVDVLEDRNIIGFSGELGLACGLSEDQVKALGRFGRALELFNDALQDVHNDEAVVRRPEFDSLVELARQTIEILAAWRSAHCAEWNHGIGEARF